MSEMSIGMHVHDKTRRYRNSSSLKFKKKVRVHQLDCGSTISTDLLFGKSGPLSGQKSPLGSCI